MRSFLTAIVVAIFFVPGLAQQSFSLDEAVQYAIRHNSEVRLERLNVTDADGRLLEFKSIGIPKLTGDVDYNYYFDIPTQLFPDFLSPAVYGILMQEGLIDPREVPVATSVPVRFGKDHSVYASLNLNAMLFDFAWLQGLKAQEMYRDLVRKNVDVKEYEIRGLVTRAYLAVLVADKTYSMLANNIRTLEQLVSETLAIYESGFIEKLDLDRLRLSLQNLRVQYDSAGRMREVARNILKFQMGYPVDNQIVLTDAFDTVADRLAVEQMDTTGPAESAMRPEYRALELTEQLNDINIRVIKSGYLPTLRLRGSYAQSLQRDRLFDGAESPWFRSTMAGISLSVPIFDGLEKKARLDRATVSRDRAILAKSTFERAMELQVENARLQVINTGETAHARQAMLELAQDIFNVTRIKYREGVGSSLELSQAETDLYTAQINYINALYDWIVARTELDIALGKI